MSKQKTLFSCLAPVAGVFFTLPAYAVPSPVLTVSTPAGEYTFSGAEIGVANGRYFLKGIEEQLAFILENNTLSALDARVIFSSEGFCYEAERTGYTPDKDKLFKDVEKALSSSILRGDDGTLRFPQVKLKTEKTAPRYTLSDAKRDTVELASFSTVFQTSDEGRSKNIELAAKRIDGTKVDVNEEFSFNGTVGARTRANGFSEAKIIQDGEFVSGFGGGVCQASTTLYNAVLSAGLSVTCRRAHSLAVSYVPPSRDAMVSSVSDFRFKNNKPFPVYLSAKVQGGEIRVTVYGRDEGYRYEVTSSVIKEIPPPEPLEKADEPEGFLRYPRAGTVSEAYLTTYRYGKLVGRKRIGEDSYAPIRGIIGVKKAANEEEKDKKVEKETKKSD